MGASLSARFEWLADAAAATTTSSGGGGGGTSLDRKQLQISVVNQDLLHELVKLLEELVHSHPTESKAEFRRPIHWNTAGTTTTGTLAAFSASTTHWSVGGVTGPKNTHKPSVASVTTKGDGQPFFFMEQQAGGADPSSFSAKVCNFDSLHRYLQVMGDQKLRELQEIIQSNRDPLNIIFGTSGDPSAALVESFEAFSLEADVKKKEQYLRLYKLLMVLNTYDLQLMKSAVQTLTKDKALGVEKISEEISMLQAFCGMDKKCALMSVEWESDYTYTNGFRSPPWRQVFGEIGYILIRRFDGDKLLVTANKKTGFFVNKGYVSDDSGSLKIDYEAAAGAGTYPTLTDLLRAHSTHFAARIDKQDYLYQPEAKTIVAGTGPGSHDHHHLHPDATSNNKEETTEESNTRRLESLRKQTVIKKKKDVKAPRSTEPSLKWRALGLTEATTTSSPSSYPGGKHGPGGGKKSSSKASGSKEGKKVTTLSTSHNSSDEDDMSDSDSDDVASDEESQEKTQKSAELPAEYYQIQKLVKYLRCGNQTATIIAICSLRDFDLTNEFNQLTIRDVGGLDTLVNLLDTDDPKCKIGALKILKDISQNYQIRQAISDLDGMHPLVELLKDSDEELKCLAAETIAHCAKYSKNRSAVRKYGGIRKLVKLLKVTPGSKEERTAISGAQALATCSKGTKTKTAIRVAGAIPLLATLLASTTEDLLIPVVGILQECASDQSYRTAIRSTGMIQFLVENLASKNVALQTHCASAIFKCAEEDETRVLVREFNGLVSLINLLENTGNKDLLVAATGAVWKCSQNLENVAAFNKLNTIKKVVGLMDNQPEEVLVNVVGALGACAQSAEGRTAIRENNGIPQLVNLLTGTNQALLVNVTRAVGACALEADSMAVIDRLDGVRFLWSLLKSTNPQVQASAAWAISPCIEQAKDAGEMVRSFVGGLELIVSLLKSEHVEVLASVCAAIAKIATDEENLAVITDHGVVPMLAKLSNTRNEKLRKYLSEAIARCCHWGNNRVGFGTSGAVAPLVKYLKSPEEAVHQSTAKALHQLSMDPDNCITMHENGVVQLLLGMVGSTDQALQEAAAGTIGNIRRLALANEKASMA